MKNNFAELYAEYQKMIERYVHYKISNHADAEDILQDVAMAAYNNFTKLSDMTNFKQWLIGIASNKCKDYYTAQAKRHDISLEMIESFTTDDHGLTETILVRDVLKVLPDKDKQILYLYYIRGFNQKDISVMLNIPIGTVKSRMSTAKTNFKNRYPFTEKGEVKMKHNKFPEFMPKFDIKKSNQEPFNVSCEEIHGWLLVPRVGNKSRFAFYDDPDGILTGYYTMDCVSEAVIHGTSCVKVDVSYEAYDHKNEPPHSKYMKLTDTHCSYVAESRTGDDGTFYFNSFIDDDWRERYEVGENNIGYEINLYQKDNIVINNNHNLTILKEEVPDIYGRYDLIINNKQYETIALLELCGGIMIIQYINTDGRTVLFRRYNRYDWKQERYGYRWDEHLPDSERFTINGDLYVHWYDCIPDFVM